VPVAAITRIACLIAPGAILASLARVHELAVMESVVDTVTLRLADERVAVVRLAIGALAGVDLDALRFCFDVCTKDTALAGAELDIRTIEPRARCRTCGGEHVPRSLASPCPCGSFDRELLAGDELRLVEVEVL
jgi:hydrogenase nickel incorporation protein HypA/HybF